MRADRRAHRHSPGTARTPGGGAGRLATVLVVTAAAAGTGWLLGQVVTAVSLDQNAPWIIGRASGLAAYLLTVALVVLGLLLSHPWRTRWSRPSTVTRIRLHIGLAVFAGAVLVLHVVVLATDRYADVGWWGALLPMASGYRPVAVTLGVIAGYAGLAAGLTATFAGSWAARLWWPVHKVAGLALVATWAHAVLAGSDTGFLLWVYVATAALVLGLGASRYLARTPADQAARLGERARAVRSDPPDSGSSRTDLAGRAR
ncbi:MAG: hypothetical protein ACK5MT_02405 [Actinomycetales bacterium]